MLLDALWALFIQHHFQGRRLRMSTEVEPDDIEFHDAVEPGSPHEAMLKIQDRLKSIHPQAGYIVSAHAALELEVDRVLRSYLRRPDKLPRLRLDHQIGVIKSLSANVWLDFVLDAVAAYGDLRNAIAHGDDANSISKKVAYLGKKSAIVGMPVTDKTNLGTLAMGLAAALCVAQQPSDALGEDE